MLHAQNVNELRPPTAFADIADREARSRALFSEAAKVITSARCMNCPSGFGSRSMPRVCRMFPLSRPGAMFTGRKRRPRL